MVNQKITELAELTAADANDVLAIVDDPVGGAATKKITASAINQFFVRTAAETGKTITNFLIEPGNIVRYGVVGDGVTDDFAAMQTAADVVSVNGGKYVVPRFSGTIMISSIIEFTGSNIEVEVNNNITCTGTAAVDAGVFRFLGATTAYLENLKVKGIGGPVLDGNGSNVIGFTPALGVNKHHSLGFHFCQKIEVSGLDLRNGLVDSFLLSFCQDAIVRNCIGRDAVHDNNFTITFNKFPGDDTTDTDPTLWARHKFYSCYSTNANDFGFTSLRAHDTTFTDCISDLDDLGFGSEELSGVKFLNGQVTFTDCIVNDAVSRGFSITRNNTTLNNCTVDGVTVTITDADGTQVLTGNGISATGIANLKVNGGALRNCSNKGIATFNTDGTGTHDGVENAATLSDSTASFDSGIDRLVGSIVYNTTDGSSGTITANTATTVTATLAGGTENDWDSGDAYTIPDGDSSVELKGVEIESAGFDAVRSSNTDNLVLSGLNVIGSGRNDVAIVNTIQAASKVKIRGGDFSGEVNLSKVNLGIVKSATIIDARLVASDCGRLWFRDDDIIFSDGFAGFNNGIVVLTTDFCAIKGCTADGNLTPIGNEATVRLGDNDQGIVNNRGSESGDSTNNYSTKGFESASAGAAVGDFPKNSMIWSNVGATGLTMGSRISQSGTAGRTLDAAVTVSGTTTSGDKFFTADNVQNIVRGNFIAIVGESLIFEVIRVDTSINKIWMDQGLTGDRDTNAVTYSTPVFVAMPNYAVSSEIITTTNVITAVESGKTFYLNAAGGFTSTLPAPAIDLRFTFIVTTAPTTAYIITTNAGANILFGTFLDTVGELTSFSAQDTLNFVASASIVGDFLEVESDGTNWYCTAKSGADGGITVSVT